MAVFVPTDVAEPSAARLPRRTSSGCCSSVHVAMGGSVLTLFTNRREMEQLYAQLAEPLRERGIPLLAQGAGVSRKRLRDEFLADERLSLFATKSFWEGFDAPGDTLRCVVVAKLPFGQLSDPLLRGAPACATRKAWDRYYLPEAIIELKQAAGRLIRTSTDDGLRGDRRLAARGAEGLRAQVPRGAAGARRRDADERADRGGGRAAVRAVARAHQLRAKRVSWMRGLTRGEVRVSVHRQAHAVALVRRARAR